MPAHSPTRRHVAAVVGAVERHRGPDTELPDRAPSLDSSGRTVAGWNETVSVERLERFSVPLPHPALFAQYDQVQQGFAERIMRMTEKKLDHQIRIEQREVELRQKIADAEIRSFTRAQWFTFVLVVVFLALAGVGLFQGQERKNSVLMISA